jgi:methylase of polypeptide subunit release factors
MNPLLRRTVYVMARLRTRRRFRLEGGVFEVAPGVLNPTQFRSSLDFARVALALAPPAPARALELGCGCGLASVLLARSGHPTSAVDVDPAAVANTRQNAAANGVALDALCSDWDRELPPGARFDYVITNPPFLAETPPAFVTALHAGPGLEAVAAALGAAHRRLAADGRVLLWTSSRSGRSRALRLIEAAGLRVQHSRRHPGLFETYHADLLEAQP